MRKSTGSSILDKSGPSMRIAIRNSFTGKLQLGRRGMKLKPSIDQWNSVIDCVPNKLLRRSDFLDIPFSADDVKKALFDMFPIKAPRTDGLPALFYQSHWDTVGHDITTACLRCLNDGDLYPTVNDTLITLIPKIDKPYRMSDFRPISLCNVTYKIVAKTLANRFRFALGDIISEIQSAFVLGRLISDTAIIGFEYDSLLFAKASVKECSNIKSILHTYALALGQAILANQLSVLAMPCPEQRGCVWQILWVWSL
ncbi:hypothetical protein Dsin_028981 [Dipteronia sinensis]|uniref:Reverse transcriptase domain-containing protein n=1 Tax=Dipteronia sinensis TaxID=43782 RepID=A0AAD9ZRK7_9ROSI|nr:hypothetical protein Dsin_028981 [Dipteronia sinensis]